ncbi:cyclin-D-binding Myb-like transcription factor 1 isoform X2 [Caretta caretta]|uniref:cyclin-D-binding Myb-like transcription factor 1 isoform X2 n=1 Tax=Caretta caretta TaxID=8467 RepID=UPI003F4C0E30
MSTVEEESDTVTVETVNSVTLTQDTEGNLILHCPQNEADEVDSEDSTEPPHKRLCLSSEDDQSIDDSTPCISVVAVPISENDQSFEVTMTATTEVADDEINEGTVTQIQILQNEQLDENCPLGSEEVSAVSQAWFTTKEDKDSLTNKGKWTEEEEKRLAEVVHELTSTEPGDIVTQGVSWAAVAERVGTRSEKQCRSKWLNYLNWKQSGGTEWTKEDEINLILRIAELEVSDENEINWDLLAEGWSSVRSPQWLRSKWWTIKRQIANHKDVSFPVLIKGLKQLHENQKNNPGHQLSENKSGSGLSNTHSNSGVQHVQIRVAHLEENAGNSPSPMAALQIPVQITHVSSTDSPAAAVDSETITLNSGTLQTFEILPSFHLQPTGTPGTYLLQTSSNQGLPLTLTTSPTVTLTAAAAPASPEQIIVHALSPEHLLNASDNVTVQCHTPSVIIRTVATEDISSVTQAELTVDSHIQSADLSDPPSTLETDTFPHDIHQSKLSNEEQSAYIDDDSSKFSGRNSTELIDGVMVRTEEEISDTDLKHEEDSHSNLTDTYVTEDLGSPAIEEQVDQTAIDDETVLIVPSPHGFIQTSDDIDNESVLPLTTLTDPILQHHEEGSHIIGSCLDSPDSEDSKDVEDLVRCH